MVRKFVNILNKKEKMKKTGKPISHQKRRTAARVSVVIFFSQFCCLNYYLLLGRNTSFPTYFYCAFSLRFIFLIALAGNLNNLHLS